jgi:16S rRNA processing protein RimM
MTNWDDAILVGVVARTHGNKGEVAVNAETDFPEERFKQGARLWSRAKDGSLDTLEVATMRMHQGRPLILFKGIGSMDDAELLAGRELRIAEAESDTELLEEGEYFHRDLIGCSVVTEDGDTVGEVTAVEGDRGNTRLVVKSRSEVLIPLADEICTVDVANKRITVRPPEGLLELNGEWRPPAEGEAGPPKRSEAKK